MQVESIPIEACLEGQRRAATGANNRSGFRGVRRVGEQQGAWQASVLIAVPVLFALADRSSTCTVFLEWYPMHPAGYPAQPVASPCHATLDPPSL